MEYIAAVICFALVWHYLESIWSELRTIREHLTGDK